VWRTATEPQRWRSRRFYRDLKLRGISTRVGLEATGYSRWFERLLAELSIEVWIGDAAEIKTKRVRKQKTDRQDAQLLLKLMLEDRFPRIWVPAPENRDLRQLLWHRHRLVQMRTRIQQVLHLNAQKCRFLVKEYSAAEMDDDNAIYPVVGDAKGHDTLPPQPRDGSDVTVG